MSGSFSSAFTVTLSRGADSQIDPFLLRQVHTSHMVTSQFLNSQPALRSGSPIQDVVFQLLRLTTLALACTLLFPSSPPHTSQAARKICGSSFRIYLESSPLDSALSSASPLAWGHLCLSAGLLLCHVLVTSHWSPCLYPCL